VKYEIEILAEARKQIKKLQKRDLTIVKKKIDQLSDDPRPHGYRSLNISTSISASTPDDIG
jgi:mRNA-degrading endonuclease RelE of RelBE toxin-antitoxin system